MSTKITQPRKDRSRPWLFGCVKGCRDLADRVVSWTVTLDELGYPYCPTYHVIAETLLRLSFDAGMLLKDPEAELLGPPDRGDLDVTCDVCGITANITSAIYDGWQPSTLVRVGKIDGEILKPVCHACCSEMSRDKTTGVPVRNAK